MSKIGVTKLFEMVEFHSNEKVIPHIKTDPDFVPNIKLRELSLLRIAVIHNNYDVFIELLNHPKFDFNKESMRWTVYRILKRVSLSDEPNNRRYLEALYSANYNFETIDLLELGKNYDLFVEVFQRDNENIHCINDLLRNDLLTEIKEFLIDYVIENKPDMLTPSYIYNNILKKAIDNKDPSIFEMLKIRGYNVTSYLTEIIINAGASYWSDRLYKKKTYQNRLIDYFLNSNLKYEKEYKISSFDDLAFGNICIIEMYYDKLKDIYTKIRMTKETFIDYIKNFFFKNDYYNKITKTEMFVKNVKFLAKNKICDEFFSDNMFFEVVKRFNDKKDIFQVLLIEFVANGYEMSEMLTKYINNTFFINMPSTNMFAEMVAIRKEEIKKENELKITKVAKTRKNKNIIL